MSQRTRVKICGITRLEDALSAIEQGADAIGLVFYAASPRHVSIAQAKSIVENLPPFITTVGLFVNAAPTEIVKTIEAVGLNLIQFHGDETPEQCKQFTLPYIKAIRVKSDTNLVQYEANFKDAKALLLDTYTDGLVGGTGQVFDWSLIPKTLQKPIILAGGLNPDNVRQAIEQVHPYAVDVSGGVEASKGIKDAAKIAAFIRGVSNAVI
jgi:phosphoribosylanthranilate isomerase